MPSLSPLSLAFIAGYRTHTVFLGQSPETLAFIVKGGKSSDILSVLLLSRRAQKKFAPPSLFTKTRHRDTFWFGKEEGSSPRMDEATLKATKLLIGSLMLIVGDLWLSVDDILESLLYWGIDKSLQPITVQRVIKDMTRQGCLSSNRFNSCRFYRSSSSSNNKCPCGDPDSHRRYILSVLPSVDDLPFHIIDEVSCLNSILRNNLLEFEPPFLPPVDQISLPSSPAPTLRDQVSFTPDNIPEITPEISTPDIHPALEIPEVTPDKEDTTETAKVLSGYRLVSNNALGCLLQDIFRLGQHSSSDATLELQSTTKIGFASRETYGTTQGEHEVMFDSCESVKSDIVPTDKKYSRFQPTLNLSIPAAARIAGISLEKLDEFLAIVGVQAPAPKNLVESMKKVELAIKQEANEQLRKNRIGHNAATRELPDYNKELDDIVWNDPLTNEVHTTTSSMGSIDGAGATRAYNHLMTGTQSAFVS